MSTVIEPISMHLSEALSLVRRARLAGVPVSRADRCTLRAAAKLIKAKDNDEGVSIQRILRESPPVRSTRRRKLEAVAAAVKDSDPAPEPEPKRQKLVESSDGSSSSADPKPLPAVMNAADDETVSSDGESTEDPTANRESGLISLRQLLAISAKERLFSSRSSLSSLFHDTEEQLMDRVRGAMDASERISHLEFHCELLADLMRIESGMKSRFELEEASQLCGIIRPHQNPRWKVTHLNALSAKYSLLLHSNDLAFLEFASRVKPRYLLRFRAEDLAQLIYLVCVLVENEFLGEFGTGIPYFQRTGDQNDDGELDVAIISSVPATVIRFHIEHQDQNTRNPGWGSLASIRNTISDVSCEFHWPAGDSHINHDGTVCKLAECQYAKIPEHAYICTQ